MDRSPQRHLSMQVSLESRAARIGVPDWAQRWGLEAIVQRLLLQFASQLDDWLRQPLWVEMAPGERRIVLFELETFVVHDAARGDGNEMVCTLGPDFQLWPFLSRREWRCVLAAALHACEGDALKRVLPVLQVRIHPWVIATCQHLLGTDSRFRQLRNVAAIKAFGFERDLVSIALRARIPGEAQALTWVQFRTVRRRASAFRQVARENPRLLSMLTAALEDGSVDMTPDPIAALANRVKTEVSPQAWRYFAKHGGRLLRLLSQLFVISPMDASMSYLRMLALAGFPPPPPPRLMRAWLCRAEGDLCAVLEPEDLWL